VQKVIVIRDRTERFMCVVKTEAVLLMKMDKLLEIFSAIGSVTVKASYFEEHDIHQSLVLPSGVVKKAIKALVPVALNADERGLRCIELSYDCADIFISATDGHRIFAQVIHPETTSDPLVKSFRVILPAVDVKCLASLLPKTGKVMIKSYPNTETVRFSFETGCVSIVNQDLPFPNWRPIIFHREDGDAAVMSARQARQNLKQIAKETYMVAVADKAPYLSAYKNPQSEIPVLNMEFLQEAFHAFNKDDLVYIETSGPESPVIISDGAGFFTATMPMKPSAICTGIN